MIMLEHYLVPGYKLTLIKAKDAKQYKLSDERKEVKDKGYFMA